MRMPVAFVGAEKPEVWLGVNYWSRAGGPRMWRDYDGAVVREELRQLRDLGLGVTRSFLFWPDVMPTPDALDEVVMARYLDFLDAHVEVGMRTIPSFIVGHMSGQNWDPAWREGRDVFSDPWFLERQVFYVREVTRRSAHHPAVAAWLLSNEIPIYGDPVHRGVGTLDAAAVTAWAASLTSAIRDGGGTQPVSTGDGVWGIEVTGADNGFRARDLEPWVDFFGPHVYRMETDQVRQCLGAAFVCELAAWGKPVVMEEFGVTSDYVGDEFAAHYYRQLLHHTLLAGATGWLAWNNCDYDHLRTVDPYRHHPHEMHFGIIDRAGRPKAQARELASFAGLVDQLRLPELTRPDADACLVVSSFLEERHPFTQLDDSTSVFRHCFQAYVAGREADLVLGVARERDGIPDDCRLYLLPSAKQLTAPGWDALVERVRAGATLYASASLGLHGTQRGLWWPDTDATFGVRRLTRYGVADRVLDREVVLRFERDLGRIKAGEELRFPVAGTDDLRSMVPVAEETAEVIARDGQGRPALLRNRLGEGWAYLATYPLEGFAAAGYEVNPEPTWRIYDALADEAGVARPVRVADPRVSAAVLHRAGGGSVVWLINLSADHVEFHAEGLPDAPNSLPPYGVAVVSRA